jgi:hypothetical protein
VGVGWSQLQRRDIIRSRTPDTTLRRLASPTYDSPVMVGRVGTALLAYHDLCAICSSSMRYKVCYVALLGDYSYRSIAGILDHISIWAAVVPFGTDNSSKRSIGLRT